MNIIAGGAQIGNIYGISNYNSKKKIDQIEFKKIFNFLKKNKIKYVDSALEYKNSLKILSNYNNKINVIIKIPVRNKKFRISDFLKDINICFKLFQSKKIYCIMIHDTNNFITLSKKNRNEILSLLNNFKKDNKIKKIGFSLYHPRELNKIINYADVIQIPMNLFDQRFDNLKIIKKILKKKIKIHVRSIFLQGLIFLNYNKISKLLNIKSKKIKLFFTKYKTKEERIFNCLNYIKTRNFISNIIIGFTDIKELEEIIKIYKKKSIKKNYKKFIIYNKNIILPYLWKKNLKN